MNDEQWMMNKEQLINFNEQWTMKIENGWMINEQCIRINDKWTMNNEQRPRINY